MNIKILIFLFILNVISNDLIAQLSFPMQGKSLNNVTSSFGPRSKGGGDYPGTNYDYDFHAAIDVGAVQGTSVYPIMDGEVVKIIPSTGTDERIYIRHTIEGESFLICYLHIIVSGSIYFPPSPVQNLF